VLSPRRCYAGDAWEWDGVRFEFLHPRPGEAPVRRNNQSCVLKVAAGGASMLLTGDIERYAEFQLLGGKIKSDIVLVPHHGSRSSSTREFVEAVSPRWAVVAAGYRNRFGHPHPEVLERYNAAGARVVRTDLDGAIHAVLDGREVRVERERARRPRYWRQVPPV
jgi:competence protein ComEC